MMGREHIRAILTLDQAAVIGLYDPDPRSIARANAEFLARAVPEPITYPDLDALANDPAVDAILICSPNFTHRTVFDQLKHSAKAIFLEKPMATTLDDALYLAEQSHRYPALIQVGMQYRFKSQYQLALSAIGRGDVGAVHMISLCEYRPAFLPKVNEWNKFASDSGGTLVEKCCHYFDLLNRIAASLPKTVFATGGRAVNFLDFSHEGRSADIDDHALVIIDYENGVRAKFALNMFSEQLFEELMVGGQRGMLRTTESASFTPGRSSSATISVEVTGHDAYGGVDCRFPDDIEQGGHYGSTLFEHDRFTEQLTGNNNDAATCVEGLWAIIVATMAQQSMTTGAVVDVSNSLQARGIDAYQAHLLPFNEKQGDQCLD